jgi:hypothetical protein
MWEAVSEWAFTESAISRADKSAGVAGENVERPAAPATALSGSIRTPFLLERSFAMSQWDNYNVGGVDQKGRKIDKIYSHNKKYIIYEAENLLQFEGDTTALDRAPVVSDLLTRAMALSPADLLRKRRVFLQIAIALDQCMEGDVAGCTLTLNAILERLKNAESALARLRYLGGAVIACALSWVVFAACRYGINFAWPELVWFQLIAFGATGAMFSVLLTQRGIPVNLDESAAVHWTAGASRIVIGLIAATCVYVAIKAKIFLAITEDLAADYATLFFCFLSGFSETFVPNLLKEKDK